MVLIKVFCYNSAKYEANFIIFFLLLLEMQSKAAVSQICLQTGGGGKCRIVHPTGTQDLLFCHLRSAANMCRQRHRRCGLRSP